jgi:hypothetical protein
MVHGRTFRTARKCVAQLCAALCLILVVQTGATLVDRLQHALHVDHAPSAVAGEYTLDAAAGEHAHETDEALPQHQDDQSHEDHGTSLPHQHASDGMLAPWLLASAPEIVSQPEPPAQHSPYSVKLHDDAAIWRRDRPPKALLEDHA